MKGHTTGTITGHGITGQYMATIHGIKIWLTDRRDTFAATAEDLVPNPDGHIKAELQGKMAEQIARIGKYKNYRNVNPQGTAIWIFETQDSRQLLTDLTHAAMRVQPLHEYDTDWPNWYTMDFCTTIENNEYAYDDFFNRKTIDVSVVRRLFRDYYQSKELHTNEAPYDWAFAQAYLENIVNETTTDE